MYNLEYLPIARKDILDITKYIAEKLQNPPAAQRLAVGLIKKCEQLRDMPYVNPIFPQIRPLNHEYRKVSFKNYLIFYWVDEQKKIITTARVIYCKRNYEELLF